MLGYFTDLALVSVLVIGITALMGSITNGIGTIFFGGKKKSEYVDQNKKIQAGWKQVGGDKIEKKNK
jgi:hypothetical protein